MFRLTIVGEELYDEKQKLFIQASEDLTVDLEHSLISLSKWEAKYQRPFLSDGPKTSEEVFGYIKSMVLTPDVDLDRLDKCTSRNLDAIQAYIDSPESATTFGRLPEARGPKQIITSELIYFWLINFNIPFECQYWHLNRLFALIRICNIKNAPQKKISKHDAAVERNRLNAERRERLNSKG